MTYELVFTRAGHSSLQLSGRQYRRTATIPVGEGAIYGVPVEGGALVTTGGSVGAYGEAGKGNIGGGVGGYVTVGSALGCGPG